MSRDLWKKPWFLWCEVDAVLRGLPICVLHSPSPPYTISRMIKQHTYPHGKASEADSILLVENHVWASGSIPWGFDIFYRRIMYPTWTHPSLLVLFVLFPCLLWLIRPLIRYISVALHSQITLIIFTLHSHKKSIPLPGPRVFVVVIVAREVDWAPFWTTWPAAYTRTCHDSLFSNLDVGKVWENCDFLTFNSPRWVWPLKISIPGNLYQLNMV